MCELCFTAGGLRSTRRDVDDEVHRGNRGSWGYEGGEQKDGKKELQEDIQSNL